jgi:predicted nucleic acid-binding protein
LTPTSCAVLVAARTTHAVLLTGDMRLRELARQQAIEVHGTLWLLEEIEQQGILSSQAAISALEGMLALGRRLPQQACARLIKHWQTIQSQGKE